MRLQDRVSAAVATGSEERHVEARGYRPGVRVVSQFEPGLSKAST